MTKNNPLTTTPEAGTNTLRKPRADATRNRALLLQAAKEAFARAGTGASLDEIARAAGVGIGTLYRHFPTRGALVEAVYRNETAQLAQAAPRLAAQHTPVEALRAWMYLFVDYIAAKQLMAEALNSIVGGTSELFAASGAHIKSAIALLVGNAVSQGAIRLDLDPLDLLRALAGVANVSGGANWEQSAKRLVDILVAGIVTAAHAEKK